MLARILLAISDDGLRTRIQAIAAGPDTVVDVLDPTTWTDRVQRSDCDLVVVDTDALPSDVTEAVAVLTSMPTAPELVVISSHESAEERAHLLGAGCLAVVSDDVADAAFGEAFETIVQKRREAAQLAREVADADDEDRFGDYISKSASAKQFLRLARKLSQSDSTALILGETGVGKERLARAIHAEGPRANGPFVVVNCGAIPESLLESELFGHEKGAFTGAVRAHRGHFELAHRGTIFLDEIGEMPLHLQVKLLRAIQEKAIQRVGSETMLQIDVRIMAATNRDLLVEMEENRFRPDLYYRLSVVALEVPPLRERREDIPALVNTYFEQFRAQMPTTAERVSTAAMQALQNYPWPGNIRELVNVVERSVLLSDGQEIALEDFPESIVARADLTEGLPALANDRAGSDAVDPDDLVDSAETAAPAATDPTGFDPAWLSQPLAVSRRAWAAEFERRYLAGLLTATRGRINETATRAGIDPRSLYTKMKQHGLRKEDFR